MCTKDLFKLAVWKNLVNLSLENGGHLWKCLKCSLDQWCFQSATLIIWSTGRTVWRTDAPAARAASCPCWVSASHWLCWPYWRWGRCPKSYWTWLWANRAERLSHCIWWASIRCKINHFVAVFKVWLKFVAFLCCTDTSSENIWLPVWGTAALLLRWTGPALLPPAHHCSLCLQVGGIRTICAFSLIKYNSVTVECLFCLSSIPKKYASTFFFFLFLLI